MAFPIIPLLLIGVGLTACATVLAKPKPDRVLYSLAGSEWGLKGEPDPFVQFKSNGELLGFGGCNNFFGNYDLNGTILTIGPLASTKKLCLGNMDIEQNFLAALQKSTRIEATHMTLKIFDSKSELLLDLQRRDWD